MFSPWFSYSSPFLSSSYYKTLARTSPRVSELHRIQDHTLAPLWFSFYFPTRFILKIINRQILMHKHIWTETPFINRGFTTSRSAKVTPLTTYMVFLHQKESSQVTNLRSKFPYSQEGIQNNFQIWKNILFYFISWTELYYLGLRNLSLH